jgi:lysophospholipase L1-like esterase
LIISKGKHSPMTSDAPKPRSLFGTVAAITLISIGTLIVVELAARAILWTPSVASHHLVEVDPTFNEGGYGDLYPNQVGIMAGSSEWPYYISVNADGLRGEPLDESPETVRVLALGDSFTFGLSVNDEGTWPASLQDALNQRLTPDQTVQVLNAGFPGYTIEDQLAYMQDKGLALHPDLVIVGFYMNDISDYRAIKREQFRRPDRTEGQGEVRLTTRIRSFLRNHLALYSLARSIVIRRAVEQTQSRDTPDAVDTQTVDEAVYINYDTPTAAEHQEYWDAYERDFRALVDLLEENDIPLMVIAIPEYTQIPEDAYPAVPQEWMRGLTEETNTSYLDLLPALRASGDIDTLYLLRFNTDLPANVDNPFWSDAARYEGDGHCSRYCYRVIGDVVAEFLLETRLITAD